MRYPPLLIFLVSRFYLTGGTMKMFQAVAGPGYPQKKRRVVSTMRSAWVAWAFIHASHFSSYQSPVSQMPMKPDRLASSSEGRPDDHGSSGVSGAG